MHLWIFIIQLWKGAPHSIHNAGELLLILPWEIYEANVEEDKTESQLNFYWKNTLDGFVSKEEKDLHRTVM